jgi:hypothetical protein
MSLSEQFRLDLFRNQTNFVFGGRDIRKKSFGHMAYSDVFRSEIRCSEIGRSEIGHSEI